MLPFVSFRTNSLSYATLAAASAHMIECALQWADPHVVIDVLGRPLDYVEGVPERMRSDPDPIKESIIKPLWTRCKLELLDACSQDCLRVQGDTQVLKPSEADERSSGVAST